MSVTKYLIYNTLLYKTSKAVDQKQHLVHAEAEEKWKLSCIIYSVYQSGNNSEIV